MDTIGPISSEVLANELTAERRTQSAEPGFSGILTDAVNEAAQAEQSANDAAQRFADGDSRVGIHEVVILAEKANISLRFAVAIKNRVLDAYRELMNTQV